MLSKPIAILLVLAASGLLAGCGDRAADDGTAGSAAASTLVRAKPGAVDNDLVKAASPSKTGAAMDMKFKLASRPVSGKPVGLTLVFTPPAEDVDRMTVSLAASDGIAIESGEGPATFIPSHGAPITHEMSVKAEHDGIYFVTAAVLVDSLNNSESSRSFSVPIIIGEGISGSAAKAPKTP